MKVALPTHTLLRVTLALRAPQCRCGCLPGDRRLATELTANLLLGAPTVANTLAMRFWPLSSGLAYPSAAPYGRLLVVLVVLAVPVTVALFQQSSRAAALW
ncbi:hypothetical protein [Mycolicibacterium hodleri]|uniref:hypothetical protein n=1 Tax=Mycolicibacterium hodleri TaxID=49897 RepID=UPI0023554C29|nr:hypothetical protein [Mycolicibacterium hodleri]